MKKIPLEKIEVVENHQKFSLLFFSKEYFFPILEISYNIEYKDIPNAKDIYSLCQFSDGVGISFKTATYLRKIIREKVWLYNFTKK